MRTEPSEKLPDEAELALAYTPAGVRGALRVLLEFDARLSRLVAATTEPMLGQMRLAWWRETLALAVDERPAGDAVLDAIGREWTGAEEALIAMVDGWENMLGDPPLSRDALHAFARGRAAGFTALAARCELSEAQREAAERTGSIWAMADAASHIGNENERTALLDLASKLEPPLRLPSELRGLAVLGALARRSIKGGGRPLMEGRGAALTALRAALAGR